MNEGTTNEEPAASQQKKTKTKKPPKWFNSPAKLKLYREIVAGDVDEKMKPKQVYQRHEIYQQYKYESFRTNLRSLRIQIKKRQDQADIDARDVAKQYKVLGKPDKLKNGEPRWNRSAAESALKELLYASDDNWSMTIDQIRATDKEAYAPFKKEVIKRHVDQCILQIKTDRLWATKKELLYFNGW